MNDFLESSSNESTTEEKPIASDSQKLAQEAKVSKPKKKRLSWLIFTVVILFVAGAGLRLSSRRRRAKPNIES
ncbi:MAG: hypothetical protein ACFCAD_00680 [Pleurocapsa sp.]